MSKKKQSGTFRFSSGLALAGELVLDAIQSHVRVHGDEYFRLDVPDKWIQGTLTDLKQITLVACQMPTEPGYSHGPSGTKYHARIYPHFILTGDHAINPDDANVERIRFFVHDHLVLSTDHDAYGSLWSLTRENQIASDLLKINPENGRLLYFTGKHEIAKAETPIGTVVIEHAPRYQFRHGFGGLLKDRIAASISFENPLTALESILRTETVARFLSLIIGRRQRIEKTFIATKESDTFLSVYRRVPMFDEHTGEQPGSFDLLIDVSKDPTQFSAVLNKWLQDEPAMAASRANLFRSLSLFTKSRSDRLITAANMFDLLPDNRVPAINTVPAALESAKNIALATFKSLDPSPERDSILSALGRLGHPSLKRKIRHQVQKISDILPNAFTNLEIITDQAVTCRNFYVHGSTPSFNYEEHPSAVKIMTEALEFVFISADLLEAGWKMREWIEKGHTASNQMSSFAVNYNLHWGYFEKLINKAR